MLHTKLYQIFDTNGFPVVPVDQIADDGVITLFFNGGNALTKVPEKSGIAFIHEYIKDSKLLDIKNQVYYLRQSYYDREEDEAILEDRENIILDSMVYQAHYFAEHLELANEVLAPLNKVPILTEDTGEDARRNAVTSACLQASRINIIGFCYGTLYTQQCLFALRRVLLDRGYTSVEADKIRSCLSCVNLAPICYIWPQNSIVPQIFFSLSNDQTTLKRINYEELLPVEDLGALGKTLLKNSLIIVSHKSSPDPLGVKVRRTSGYDLADKGTQAPATVSIKGSLVEILALVKDGKIEVCKVQPPIKRKNDDPTHSPRHYTNRRRLTGSQVRDGFQIFTFQTSVGTKVVHDTYVTFVTESQKSIDNSQPRDLHRSIRRHSKTLNRKEVARREEQFDLDPIFYAGLLEKARQSGVYRENFK